MRKFAFEWILVVGVVLAPWTVARSQDAVKNEPHVTLSDAEVNAVLGVYSVEAEPETEVSVYREDTHLFAEGERNPRVEIFAVTKDRFVAENYPAEFDFLLGASGRASSLHVKFRGQVDEALTLIEDTPRKLNHFREYTKQDVMIPARDGVKLHVVILRPAGSESSGESLPFLLMRTPYGVDGLTSDRVNAGKPELAASGYILFLGTFAGGTRAKGNL